MADKSVDLGATNLFSLGANFHSQDSGSIHERAMSNMQLHVIELAHRYVLQYIHDISYIMSNMYRCI